MRDGEVKGLHIFKKIDIFCRNTLRNISLGTVEVPLLVY